MPDETAIPKAGSVIDDPGRQVAEYLAQGITDAAVEKIAEDQAVPVALGRCLPHSVMVA
jgi:hypothetical protein